jgi:hypothetical protein
MESSARTEPLGTLTSSQLPSARVTRELLAASSLQVTRRPRTEPALLRAPVHQRQAQQLYVKRSAQRRLHVLLSLLAKEAKPGLANSIPPHALVPIHSTTQTGTGTTNSLQLLVSQELKVA